IAFYEKQNKLARIDGTQAIDDITEAFHDVLARMAT
ncbi:MAG: adenylate kinase, partial [Halothiobacillus sp.]|nr:adenylate kinase [Halothiobacillus sp.]